PVAMRIASSLAGIPDMDRAGRPMRPRIFQKRLPVKWLSARCRAPPFSPCLALVLVVAAPPDARLVASLGRAVEPRVHAPEAVQPARIGGIGVVDDAVLERERAHARPLAQVGGRVGSGHRRHRGDISVVFWLPRILAPVVVFGALALLLLREPDAEVGVE